MQSTTGPLAYFASLEDIGSTPLSVTWMHLLRIVYVRFIFNATA